MARGPTAIISELALEFMVLGYCSISRMSFAFIAGCLCDRSVEFAL